LEKLGSVRWLLDSGGSRWAERNFDDDAGRVTRS
jgi:hypothetical protein